MLPQWLVEFYTALARERSTNKSIAKHIPRKFQLVNNPGSQDMFILDPEKKLEIRALAAEMKRRDEQMQGELMGNEGEQTPDSNSESARAETVAVSPTASNPVLRPTPTKRTVTYFNRAATELINREKELGTFSRFEAAAFELKTGPFPPHIQMHKHDYLHASIDAFVEGLYNKMGVQALVVYSFQKEDGSILVAEFVFKSIPVSACSDHF